MNAGCSLATVLVAVLAVACSGGTATPTLVEVTATAGPVAEVTASPTAATPVVATPTPAATSLRWQQTAEPWFLDGEMLRSFGGDGMTSRALFSTPECDPFYQAVHAAEAFEGPVQATAHFLSTRAIAAGYTSAFLTTDVVAWESEDIARQVFELEVAAQAAHTRGACLRALMLQANGVSLAARPHTADDIKIEARLPSPSNMSGFRLSAPTAGALVLIETGIGNEVLTPRKSDGIFGPLPNGLMVTEHWVMVRGRATMLVDFLSYATEPDQPYRLPASLLAELERQLREIAPATPTGTPRT